MAQSFREAGPDRLVIQEGGGAFAIFGVPFLCAGVFMCLGALGVVPISNASRVAAYTLPVLALMGLLFASVGGAFVFGRTWTTIDATRREVVKAWGLLRPMRSTVLTVDADATISIGFESGDSNTAGRYPIVLRQATGLGVRLASFSDYATSRECAAAAAKHLRLALEDATTDHARRMLPSHADLSFAQRARVEKTRLDAAERPATARSTVIDEGGRTRIVIPDPPLHPVVLAFMLVPMAMPLLMVWPLSRFGRIFLIFVIVGFGILPATSILTAWLRSRFGQTIVTLSSEGFVVETRSLWRTRTQATIAAADIVDVDFSTRESSLASARIAVEQRVRDSSGGATTAPVISPGTARVMAVLGRFAKGRGVIVKTRHGFTTFGGGLADDEIRYLHALVGRALIR